MADHQAPFRIAIIGSGPIGKLLLSSVTPHPRITYSQYEAETLPLRPAYGYGVGPQTLFTTSRLNARLGAELRQKCFISPVWMHFRYGGVPERELPRIEVPRGEYGRVGRDELLQLLDEYRPGEYGETEYGKKVTKVERLGEGRLGLGFEDGAEQSVDAVWGCDGMNSLCRKLVQGEEYRAPVYSDMISFRGKIDAKKVEEQVGSVFARETYMFIGVTGWHILIFPIAGGKLVNIATFAVEGERRRVGRDYVTSTEEILGYFKGANETVIKLLHMLNEQPGGCQRLELTTLETLGTFYNPKLNMTLFGDAANGMPPYLAGSMSTGFIGVTTFLKDELNPRIEALKPDASKEEIAEMLVKASEGYEKRHRPLAQKLVDYSLEQGKLWSGGELDGEKLSVRPRFLWQAAFQGVQAR